MAPCRRVVRGGSWNNNPQNLRSANRNRNTTDNRNNNLGFRLARTSFAGAAGIKVLAGVHLTFRAVHDEHGRGLELPVDPFKRRGGPPDTAPAPALGDVRAPAGVGGH